MRMVSSRNLGWHRTRDGGGHSGLMLMLMLTVLKLTLILVSVSLPSPHSPSDPRRLQASPVPVTGRQTQKV